MVKNILIRMLINNSGLILNSLKNAYKNVIQKSNTRTNSNYFKYSSNKEEADNSDNNANNKESHRKGSFGKFSFQNLVSSPMTKLEAIKILEISSSEKLNSNEIMQKFDKLMKINNPENGGSFYIQNKIYYAKEYLMDEFPKEENISDFNPKI